MRPRSPRPAADRSGYTLTELLVVILIILLLSAASLPAILPAIEGRNVANGAQLIYGELTRAHDEAVRGNAPRGIRLIPDPNPDFANRPNILTSSRLIAIEAGPDYSEGEIRKDIDGTGPIPFNVYSPLAPQFGGGTVLPLPTLYPSDYPYLVVHEDKFQYIQSLNLAIPKPSTSWFLNIRQGDKLRLNKTGTVYTVAGPVANPSISYAAGSSIISQNAERFVWWGPGVYSTSANADPSGTFIFEFLFLTNGKDDDGDGYVDEGFDGINNDNDFYPTSHPLAGQPVIDPGFNGIDDDLDGAIDDPKELYLHINADGSIVYPGNPFGLNNGGFPPPASSYTPTSALWAGVYLPNEYEQESFRTRDVALTNALEYTISRRPVPSRGAREIALPTNVVIDLTTWNAMAPFVPERSRVPVDPFSGIVDILIAPNGRLINRGPNGNLAPTQDYPFYHLWITDAEDVRDPTEMPSGSLPFQLPMPNETSYDPTVGSNQVAYPSGIPTLSGNRRLISINAETGQISTNTIEEFATNNVNKPYEKAIQGTRENP